MLVISFSLPGFRVPRRRVRMSLASGLEQGSEGAELSKRGVRRALDAESIQARFGRGETETAQSVLQVYDFLVRESTSLELQQRRNEIVYSRFVISIRDNRR